MRQGQEKQSTLKKAVPAKKPSQTKQQQESKKQPVQKTEVVNETPQVQQVQNEEIQQQQQQQDQVNEQETSQQQVALDDRQREEQDQEQESQNFGQEIQQTQEGEQLLQEEETQQQQEHFIETKYGDQKIDLSDIQQNIQEFQNNSQLQQDQDPTRPSNLNVQPTNANEPLPSYSNRVNLGEFSVGNYKEFQLREDLAHLIEKYNKQFYGDAKKPVIHKQEINQNEKGQRYQDKVILNPIAVPNPAESQGNYSWMYLITPYYNQLVKEFSTQQLENDVLRQHYEYYVEMQKEQELLQQEFDILKNAEQKLLQQIDSVSNENGVIEDKVMHLERNLTQVMPQRVQEVSEKMENLNNVLKAKDNVIEQLLNEITLVKNEKDDLQNEVLFKKQRIDNMNMEYNTKELEYQRLWEEEQRLKEEVRGENTDSRAVKRENEMLLREIAMVRDEINEQQAIYEQIQSQLIDGRTLVSDYENRLRYANDVIGSLEAENQQIELDLAQQRACIESQNRAYNELRQNFYMMNNFGSSGQLQMNQTAPIISIPKVVMPSNYYKPNLSVQKATINLMPSTSKALSQQVVPNNIKSYLSVKKATIDLTSDMKIQSSRDQKVRFSMIEKSEALGSSPQGGAGYSNLPAQRNTISGGMRRSDSMDQRIERRGQNKLQTQDSDFFGQQSPRSAMRQSTNTANNNQRVQSVNRNFVDSMSGILGMNDDAQNLINLRASVQSSNTFPLRKPEIIISSASGSPQKSQRDSMFQDSPNKGYRTMETDVSTDNFDGQRYIVDMNESLYGTGRNSNMSTQTPFKNKVTVRGGPGNRSSQPQQLNSVKQRNYQTYGKNQAQQEEEKYRQSTWEERMNQLPKNSAYKSSITFAEDGITLKNEQPRKSSIGFYDEPQQNKQPFKVAKDYDIDIDNLNENDPQAKAQIIKFKQQKVLELSDQRKLVIYN